MLAHMMTNARIVQIVLLTLVFVVTRARTQQINFGHTFTPAYVNFGHCLVVMLAPDVSHCTAAVTMAFKDPEKTETAFENCHMDDPEFDHCIKDALNSVRPYFKTGVPQWNIPPFDPFFAKEVVQTTGIPMFHYSLKLKNVTESGWTVSQVTTFKSDFNKNLIEYTQFFPEKFLNGHYEFTGSVFGNKLSNSGTWNLALYDFIQSTQISKPIRNARDNSLRVKVTVHTCRDMKLHVSHLLGGRRILEILMDRIINAAWPPGFMILRPLVNDLVSTAFSDIFNGIFKEFPFHDLIK